MNDQSQLAHNFQHYHDFSIYQSSHPVMWDMNVKLSAWIIN